MSLSDGKQYGLVYTLSVLLLFLPSTTGCGGGGQSAEARLTAGEAYAAALSSYKSGDLQAAKASFDIAISGGLNADSFEDAALNRAIVCAKLDLFDEAMDKFDSLEQGGSDLGRIYATKAYVLAKKGDKSAAKQAMAKAKKYNPRIKPIRD